jgi:hypothetical protein
MGYEKILYCDYSGGCTAVYSFVPQNLKKTKKVICLNLKYSILKMDTF